MAGELGIFSTGHYFMETNIATARHKQRPFGLKWGVDLPSLEANPSVGSLANRETLKL